MRKLFSTLACVVCLSAALSAKTAFDKATLESYLRHYFVIGPNVNMQVSEPKPSGVPGLKEVDVALSVTGQPRVQHETVYISDNGEHIFYGKMMDINTSPFAPELDKLQTGMAPSFGPANAPVSIVLFSDFECPVCKQEAEVLRQNLVQKYPTQVRVYFKNLPLEPIHPWAMPAAIAGRCIYNENADAFWKYYDWMYAHQQEITPANLKDKVLEFAKANNLDTVQLVRCMDNKTTEPEIRKEIQEAHALNVDQTPYLFINGRRIAGAIPWQQLQAIVDNELGFQKTARAADESCCEVKIPMLKQK